MLQSPYKLQLQSEIINTYICILPIMLFSQMPPILLSHAGKYVSYFCTRWTNSCKDDWIIISLFISWGKWVPERPILQVMCHTKRDLSWVTTCLRIYLVALWIRLQSTTRLYAADILIVLIFLDTFAAQLAPECLKLICVKPSEIQKGIMQMTYYFYGPYLTTAES